MKLPRIQFGLETEYGITSDAPGEVDVVAESIALVRSVTAPGIAFRWDYDCEDPHLDMRGFRVRELRQDTDEADYSSQDAQRDLSYFEIKSDIVLGNGGRLYNDHTHPEYCTPECSSPEQLMVHDRAGERILMACARQLSQERGSAIRLYKNNTDLRGHSYGCHENYLIPRALGWDKLVQAITAFLVTRQVYAGSGKFAIEAEDQLVSHGFQISQRSDFFTELQSVDTMQRRPLINTRDEPHADPEQWRRFHVIIGDSNMTPFATWLKVGATALVLEAISIAPSAAYPRLADPLKAVRSISHDPSFKWEVRLGGRRASTAIAVQRAYLALVREFCDLSSPARATLTSEWEKALTDLEADWMRCRNRLDWPAKLAMVREFQAQQHLADDDPWLLSLDLEYHRLDLADGLYYALEQAGGMVGVPEETEVRAAMEHPPATTRAAIRGKCIQRFGQAILSAQWDHVTLQGSRGPVRLSLMDLFDPAEIRRLSLAVDAAQSPDDLRSVA